MSWVSRQERRQKQLMADSSQLIGRREKQLIADSS